jgi:intein/homing endonuclease
MFITRKPILLLHLFGQVIRTTADHPFFVQSQGWTEAADLRPGDPLLSQDGQPVPVEGISERGEKGVVYTLFPDDYPMLDRSPPNGIPRLVLGFAAGTPILTPDGPIPIEELRPGDFILLGPDGSPAADQGADQPDGPELPRL